MKRERIEQLTYKCRVKLAYDEDAKGTVVGLGPEQSEVKFDDRTVRILSNTDLIVVKEAK